MKPNLKLVEKPAIDIYANWKAEIQSRDWGRVHVWGDGQKPLELADSRKGWR